MLTFWIIAALLVLFVLWFVIPSLLEKPNESEEVLRREANVLVYKDQYRELDADLKNGLIGEEQYQQEKSELDRRLLEDVTSPAEATSIKTPINKFAYGVAAFLPIGAIALYFVVGNPKGLNPESASATVPPAAANQPGQMSEQQIAANIEKLAARLKQQPDDAQGWKMLGRSYMMQDRFADAAIAYERLTTLNPKDADAWTDYAEALGMANGRILAGKPTDAINRALQINPRHERGLDLAGTAAYQKGDYQKAIEYWQQLLKLLPAGSEDLRMITDQISKAKELAQAKGSR